MADTRCANPEYQLDVDVMVVEHTLYQAIESKLKSMRFDVCSDDADDQSDRASAERLIENFNILIRLFRHNHPTATLSEGTTFSIKILEFLVLFGEIGKSETQYPEIAGERAFNTNYRRRWLEAWASDPNTPGRDIKSYIVVDSDAVGEDDNICLNDILVRFMDLSAEISDCMGQVNERWYTLAGEFMLQCALERLQNLQDNSALHFTNPAITKLIATWISECFAWGMNRAYSLPEEHRSDAKREWAHEHLEVQSFIGNMFRLRAETGDARADDQGDLRMADTAPDGDNAATEDPHWTNLRTKYHSKAFRVIKACDNTKECTCYRVLEDLRARYPVQEFMATLHDFVEGVWCVNMDNISGKPVLIQIEEGGIDGLDDAEFKVLLDRVGLKLGTSDDGGRRFVKWIR